MDDDNEAVGDDAPETDGGPSGEGETNGPEADRCRRCGTTDPPDEKGLCPTPTCRGFRLGNPAAVVHGGRSRLTAEDYTTRDELIATLLGERGGRGNVDLVSTVRIEDYAVAVVQLRNVARRLEHEGPVTTAGRRRSLVDVYKQFSERVDRLGAELPPPTGRTSNPGMANAPDWSLEAYIELLEKHLRGETLSERELGRLDVLDRAMADPRFASLLGPTEPPAAPAPVVASPPAASPAPAPLAPSAPASPAPEAGRQPAQPTAEKPARGLNHEGDVDWNSLEASEDTSRFIDLLRRCCLRW